MLRQERRTAMTRALAVTLLLLLAWASPGRAADLRAMAAAQQILDQAHAEVAASCAKPPDGLERILCAKQLRVGLRTFYPGFSVRDAKGNFSGFEVDIARAIADFLGVRMVPVAVDPKTRIPMVASGDVDLVIATMGHTVDRDSQVRFIRPHYYASRTVVVGARDSPVKDWDDLAGQTVCIPLGSASNMLFIRHHVRILTFDQPEQLLDALAFDECAYIVQDNTFFTDVLSQPRWSQYAIKFGFAPLPWGMAVARNDTTQLATLLDDLSAAWHTDGTFLGLAEKHGLDDDFLKDEMHRWSSPRCITANGMTEANCLIPPVDTSDAKDVSTIASQATWLEVKAADWLGWQIDLTLLKHESAVSLLIDGILYSLVLVAGAMLSTMAFALGLAWLMGHGPVVTRRAVATLAAIGQTSPLPLLLFFGYIVAGGLVRYSGPVALIAAVVVLGFFNGANAGRAINEAYHAAQTSVRGSRTFLNAVSVSSVQLVAFLINATKGSPAAGMIGVPEFLNVMTDLTASSRNRVVVYLILLVFYTGVVLCAIAFLSRLETRLSAAGRAQR